MTITIRDTHTGRVIAWRSAHKRAAKRLGDYLYRTRSPFIPAHLIAVLDVSNGKMPPASVQRKCDIMIFEDN